MTNIFTFNNTNIGNIDKYINEKFYNDGKLFRIELNIQNNLVINVSKYKNEFTFIINECKEFFHIEKTNYNIVLIDNIPYLAYKNLNNVSLNEYLQHTDVKNKLSCLEIQRIFIFNWLMCVNNNFENKIYVFPSEKVYPIADVKNTDDVYFLTINEKSYKIDSFKSKISENILNKWFKNSEDFFNENVRRMIKFIDPNFLRRELIKIVNKHNNDYVYWVNSVYEKILNLKTYLF